MRKEELVHIHILLVQFKNYCEENGLVSDLTKYTALKISPFEMHRSKEEHKRAIMILCTELVAALNSSTMPPVLERNPRPRKLRSIAC
ncbi:MAG: UPF0058 family protein [Methanomicrobia archaeon]|nr:UPF0058 family protein [Methanomicrobia archaeon]